MAISQHVQHFYFFLETCCDIAVEELFLSGGPISSAAVRVAVIHDSKEDEGERQQEEQVDRRDEEIGKVDGDVEEEVTQHMHETWL